MAKKARLPAPLGLRLEREADQGTLIVSFPVQRADFDALLSGAETEIARDIMAGLSNAAIAERRGTALRTIANQVASIFRKLRVRSRLELSLYASSRHDA